MFFVWGTSHRPQTYVFDNIGLILFDLGHSALPKRVSSPAVTSKRAPNVYFRRSEPLLSIVDMLMCQAGTNEQAIRPAFCE